MKRILDISLLLTLGTSPLANALNPIKSVTLRAKACAYWLTGTTTGVVSPLLSRALADPDDVTVYVIREKSPDAKNSERILRQDYGWDWREPEHKDGITIIHLANRETYPTKGDLVIRYSHDDPETPSVYVVESSNRLGPYVELPKPYSRTGRWDLFRYQLRIRNLPDLLQHAFASTVPTISANAHRIEQRLQAEDRRAKLPREPSGRLAF